MLFVAKGKKNTRLYSPDWSPTVAPGGGRWRSSLVAVTWTGSGSTMRTKRTNKIRPLLQNKPSPRPVWWWRLALENPCLNPLKSTTVQKHESGVTRGIRQNTAVTFGPSQRVSKDDDSVCLWFREQWRPEKALASSYLPEPQHGWSCRELLRLRVGLDSSSSRRSSWSGGGKGHKTSRPLPSTDPPYLECLDPSEI